MVDFFKKFFTKNHLPQILLIGDSIRMGYTPYVQKQLKQMAQIVIINENCEDSKKVINNLEKWVNLTDKSNLKIIHFNCGLHDIKRKKLPNGDADQTGPSANQQPIEEYSANLKQITKYLKENTSARLIWATITPVIHQRHHANKEMDRFEEDVDHYNRVACQIMVENQIPINDLNAIIHQNEKEKLILKDGVHYTKSGYKFLANAVAETLRKYF